MPAQYYLHDLDPVIFKLPFLSLKVRWYGLAYVMGFLFGIWLLQKFAECKWLAMPREKVADFITYTALFGVMLGGRLGYMLFYDRARFFANPASFFDIGGGGMASHGGILGMTLFALWYSRRHQVPWTNLGDALVIAAPIGVFFGRIANFINGELYGRATNVAWAMQFPGEVYHDQFLKNPPPALMTESIRDFLYGAGEVHTLSNHDIVAEANRNPDLMEALRNSLTPRHPSQLYAAVLEGLLLFAILLLVRTKARNLPDGIITGLFFLLYAIVRIADEFFREPDDGSYRILGLTKGQFYSTFMVVIGLAFLLWGWKHGVRRNLHADPSSQETSPA